MFNIEEVDTDGALREAADAVEGDTRLSFLQKAGLGAGALVGSGAILGALATGASAQAFDRPPAAFGSGDVGILNYALTLEYLERAFYNAAKEHNIAKGDGHLLGILNTVVRDERAHVAFLQKGLGSSAVKQPKFDFGSATRDKATFVATAYALENTGVHAYLGQAGNIVTPAYLYAAATIVTIEARHAGAIGDYIAETEHKVAHQRITPAGSFDKGYGASQVLAIVKSTKFIKS